MAEQAINPIEQFNVAPLFSSHKLGHTDVAFTNASLLMVIILGLVSLLMIYGTSRRSLVPGRLQAAAEMSYEFVADTVRGTAGNEGMRFFPFVFSLFMFVLFANLLGLLPFSYTVTSQIVVTFALAALVMLIVIGYGLFRHGTHFLGLFAPSGVAKPILPFIVLIEVISFLSRPISLSRPALRQHAGRPHHAEGVRRLRGAAAGLRHRRGADRAPALRRHHHPHRFRAARGRPAGLRVRHPDLRLPQRRDPPGPLINIQQQTVARPHSKREHTWIPPRPSIMADAYMNAAKFIGAGLAAIGMGAAAIGVGTIFGNFLSGALRNPSAADGQFGRAFIGAALAEGLGIFAFLVAILLLFVK